MRVKHLSNSHGFSLPELLVVVCIIGLAVAASIPTIGEQVRSAKIRTVANQFVLTMRAARMIAVSKRADSAVQIDRDAQNFSYMDAYGRQRRIVLPKGARVAETTTTDAVVFRPNGSVAGGTQTIVFESVRGRDVRERWIVQVNPIGGVSVVHEDP